MSALVQVLKKSMSRPLLPRAVRQALTHCLVFREHCHILEANSGGGRNLQTSLKIHFKTLVRFMLTYDNIFLIRGKKCFTVFVIEKGTTKVWSLSIMNQPWQWSWSWRSWWCWWWWRSWRRWWWREALQCEAKFSSMFFQLWFSSSVLKLKLL